MRSLILNYNKYPLKSVFTGRDTREINGRVHGKIPIFAVKHMPLYL